MNIPALAVPYNIICGGASCPPKPASPEAAAFENAFSGWEERFVTDLSKGSLAVDKSAGEKPIVHSEGMAYGLYFAVLSGNRRTFEKLLSGLENYAQNINGLYSWRLTPAGEVLENFSAADGDIYAAAAVTLAFAKWKDPRYQQIAQRLIDAIWQNEILEYKGYHFILPSDGEWPRYKDGRFVYNPSYFAPSLLRIFAAADRNPNHKWNKVIDDGYRILDKALENANRLGRRGANPVPDWLLVNVFDGKLYLDKYTVTPDREFDAVRVYLELARDAALSKDPRSQKTADKLLAASPSPLGPATVRIAGENNDLAVSYNALLLSASSQSNKTPAFLGWLRKSYQPDFIGRTGKERDNYYFQSLLLHAAALLGGYSFDLQALNNLFPAKDGQTYFPFNIFANEDGSVYVNHTLIFKYSAPREGRTPFQRALASADALTRAYRDGHLLPKYLEKESDPRRGAMEANYYGGLGAEVLFELGPEDFGAAPNASLGYRWTSGLYRWAFDVNYGEKSWLATAAQAVGIKARKNSLEFSWDSAYSRIYQNLVRSRIIDFKETAQQEIENPAFSRRVGNRLVDFYTLTNSARAREVANFSRAYDDIVSLRRFISAFLEKNPFTGFSRPNGYYETLFSLATILADQDGRYQVSLVKDLLDKIETQVKCRENYIPTGRCLAGSAASSTLPIKGLGKSRSYLEAAGKILETVIQSDVSNYGYKARALREKADLAFRLMEKGVEVSEASPLAATTAKEIVGDYLSALEVYKEQFNLSGLIAGNWRGNPSHKEVLAKLSKPGAYYGLAEKYAASSFGGDMFELAKICISLGKFYLFTHAREERFDELPPFDSVRHQGLKEAEIWFKFVVKDPRGIFDSKELRPYKIEALTRLGETQLQLGFLESARGNQAAARQYFDASAKTGQSAYQLVKIEINRTPAQEWANEGTSMNLRNIYFNALLGAARINLRLGGHAGIAEANAYMDEALQNRDLIIFGSTKREVYQTAAWALASLIESAAAQNLPVQKLASVVTMDSLSENSFELVNLQLLSLAAIVYYCLLTGKNIARLVPLDKISRILKQPLGLEDVDLSHTPDALRLIMKGLVSRPVVPEKIKNEISRQISR